MKNIVKIALVAVSFMFVVGCSTQSTPDSTVHTDTISNTQANIKASTDHAQKCKHKKCHDKLGKVETKKDTMK
jgi:hypothetical protein